MKQLVVGCSALLFLAGCGGKAEAAGPQPLVNQVVRQLAAPILNTPMQNDRAFTMLKKLELETGCAVTHVPYGGTSTVHSAKAGIAEVRKLYEAKEVYVGGTYTEIPQSNEAAKYYKYLAYALVLDCRPGAQSNVPTPDGPRH